MIVGIGVITTIEVITTLDGMETPATLLNSTQLMRAVVWGKKRDPQEGVAQTLVLKCTV